MVSRIKPLRTHLCCNSIVIINCKFKGIVDFVEREMLFYGCKKTRNSVLTAINNNFAYTVHTYYDIFHSYMSPGVPCYEEDLEHKKYIKIIKIHFILFFSFHFMEISIKTIYNT